MKTHKGKLVNYLVGNEIYTSSLNGSFDGGFTTMRLYNLDENVEGKDLVYDVMLKELAKYKKQIKEGKELTIHVEWDITDDYFKYLACRVLSVEIKERGNDADE